MLFDEGTVMDEFLDQIEDAVVKKTDKQKQQLKKQYDARKISPKTFKQKSKDLEVWAAGERKEIN